MSIYLEIKAISGNVTTLGYEGAIQVNNYHLSTSRSINKRTGINQNRTIGLVHFGSLNLIKAVDKSSTDLLQYFYSAKVIPEARFHHMSTGPAQQCYLVNTFYDLLIGRFDESNHEDGVLENIEMVFSRYEKRNMPLDNNMKTMPPRMVGYDLEEARAI